MIKLLINSISKRFDEFLYEAGRRISKKYDRIEKASEGIIFPKIGTLFMLILFIILILTAIFYGLDWEYLYYTIAILLFLSAFLLLYHENKKNKYATQIEAEGRILRTAIWEVVRTLKRKGMWENAKTGTQNHIYYDLGDSKWAWQAFEDSIKFYRTKGNIIEKKEILFSYKEEAYFVSFFLKTGNLEMSFHKDSFKMGGRYSDVEDIIKYAYLSPAKAIKIFQELIAGFANVNYNKLLQHSEKKD